MGHPHAPSHLSTRAHVTRALRHFCSRFVLLCPIHLASTTRCGGGSGSRLVPGSLLLLLFVSRVPRPRSPVASLVFQLSMRFRGHQLHIASIFDASKTVMTSC